MCVILVLGVATLTQLPREDFPQITFYFAVISVPYPGVSVDDIERNVTIKIEDEMSDFDDLRELRSFTLDGVAIVTLEFDETLSQEEFDTRFQEVRSRFNNIILPDDVGDALIDTFSSADFLPVIQVIVSGDQPYTIIAEHAERLQDILEDIPDVPEITMVGLRDSQVVVEVHREQAETRGISLSEVSTAIANNNITVPGGSLRGVEQVYLLRTDESLTSADEIKDIAIRAMNGFVTVGDIAAVTEQYDRDDPIVRYNGQTAISLTIPKKPYGDSVGVVDEIRAQVEKYRVSAPAGLEFSYFNDSSAEVRRNIRTLGRNIVFGFVLVVLMLYFFLGIRNSLLTALGIPISFAATFFALSLFGETLNSNVLFGLVLVLGLIVDHAIVIIENCYRLNLEGASRHDAAIRGVNQVITPVIAATATTVAAFIPLTFLPGVIGKFLRVLPITVSIALIASTLEALIILPSHYADWGRKKRSTMRNEHRFNQFRDAFGRLLTRLYKHRLITVIIFAVLIVSSVALFGTVAQELFVSDEFSYFFIDIEMPIGTSLERTDEVVRQYERRLIPLIERESIISITASSGFTAGDDGNATGTHLGQLTVDLLDISEGRTEALDDIIDEARLLVADIAGPELTRFRKLEGGPPTDPPVAYRLQGDSFDELQAISTQIQERLGAFPQLVDIRDNLESGSPELRIVIDNDKAARLGFSPRQIGGVIRNSFDGIEAGVIFKDNKETDIIVRYDPLSISRPEQVLQLRLRADSGARIPLSSFASLETGNALSGINRVDQKREVLIEAGTTDSENLFIIDNDIEQFFNEQLSPLFPDVKFIQGGQFAQFANLLSDILLIMGIGVFLIYTILGAQFKSYGQPFIILLTIPFALLGVILYLIISNTSLSLIVLYASVALAGIAVNDSIVLISFINTLRAAGKPIGEAIISAARLRLRPIILTSLTTIVGLLPTSLGLGGRSIVWVPMANTMIFGLLFSTTSTLIIVPCIYGLFYDHKRAKQLA